MKIKILLLSSLLSGCLAVNAKTVEPEDCKKKKNEQITGSVISADSKKPVKAVVITAIIDTKKEKKVQTDQNGNYAIGDLKPGTYSLTFEKKGFKKSTRQTVVVKTDESLKLDIELVETPEYNILPTPFHFSDM